MQAMQGLDADSGEKPPPAWSKVRKALEVCGGGARRGTVADDAGDSTQAHKADLPTGNEKIQIQLPRGTRSAKRTATGSCIKWRQPTVSQHGTLRSKDGKGDAPVTLDPSPTRSTFLPSQVEEWRIPVATEPSSWVPFGEESPDAPKSGSPRPQASPGHKPSKSFGDAQVDMAHMQKGSHRRVLSADQKPRDDLQLRSAMDEFSRLALSRSVSNPVAMSEAKQGDGEAPNLSKTMPAPSKAEPDLIFIEERQWLKDEPDPGPPPNHSESQVGREQPAKSDRALEPQTSLFPSINTHPQGPESVHFSPLGALQLEPNLAVQYVGPPLAVACYGPQGITPYAPAIPCGPVYVVPGTPPGVVGPPQYSTPFADDGQVAASQVTPHVATGPALPHVAVGQVFHPPVACQPSTIR